MSALTYETAWSQLYCGKLDKDFSQWALSNKSGWTIAHCAADKGLLPADFDQWDMADNNGWTVAHLTVKRRTALPLSFNRWDLITNSGLTVAHMAAEQDVLPVDFDQWDLINSHGETVADLAPKAYRRWQILKELEYPEITDVTEMQMM
jgi:hypothetical protein